MVDLTFQINHSYDSVWAHNRNMQDFRQLWKLAKHVTTPTLLELTPKTWEQKFVIFCNSLVSTALGYSQSYTACYTSNIKAFNATFTLNLFQFRQMSDSFLYWFQIQAKSVSYLSLRLGILQLLQTNLVLNTPYLLHAQTWLLDWTVNICLLNGRLRNRKFGWTQRKWYTMMQKLSKRTKKQV